MAVIRGCGVMLLAGLVTGCGLTHDSQVDSLDLDALQRGEGYVVGTFTTFERHSTARAAPVTFVSPDLDYTVIVREAHVPVSGDELTSYVRESGRTWDIGVEGEGGPMLFALRLPSGLHHLDRVELQKGNAATSAPICLDFEVSPGTITYIGDVYLELHTTERLFATRILNTVRSGARDEQGVLEQLLPERFPDAPPVTHVAIASFGPD